MFKPFMLAASLCAFSSCPAARETKTEPKPPHPQQKRMADCSKEAGDRKAEARRKFMAACVKEKKAAARPR